MRLTPAQLSTLKSELDNDPRGLGYSGKTDQKSAVLLNTVGLSGEKITKDSILPSNIVSALDHDDLKNLTTQQLLILLMYTGNGILDATNALIEKTFKGLFAQGTPTRANLLALSQQDATRAEALFGKGTTIMYWDVAAARAL